jgi:GDP-L-fucose synthase
MGELQAEAYRIEHGWDRISIVRPANIYGPSDNFDPENAMVIPSLIRRALDGENPLVVWGDGSAIRDFIFASDVARGMLLAVEQQVRQPINLASGQGVSIRQLVEIIVRFVDPPPTVVWDRSKPSGDRIRLMDVSRARAIGFAPAVSIDDGIRRTIEWYRAHKSAREARFNVFTAGAPV